MISSQRILTTLSTRGGFATVEAPGLRTRMGRLPKVPVVSIIDDDESVRIATGSLVRSLGFEVHTFASAEDFLESPHVTDTSCLIMDIQMPGTSGIELQRFLLAQGHRTPIIFITAFPEERLRMQSLEAGAVGFLSKPFEGQALVKCLHAALEKKDDDEQ